MNIQTVASNLRNTIAGKEQLVAHYREVAANQGTPGNINFVMATFVQDNIDELKRILQDVEQCAPKNIYNDMDPGGDYLDGTMIKMFRDDYSYELDPNRGWK
jgi:hypothetical protein